MGSFGESARQRRGLRAFGVLAACGIAALSAGRVWLIPAHFSNDPNEGWNAILAMRALGAGPLYPPAAGLLANNYPPLSFYLIGITGRLTGDAIVAGRVIALLATCAVAGGVFVLARRLGGSGVVAALLLLGLACTLLRPYLAMDDPQWLAQATMLAGVERLMPAAPTASVSARRAAEAAVIMVTAGMIKHNVVAAPVAVTAWLAWQHRHAATAWVLTGAAGLLIVACCCYRLYGITFFLDVFATPRRYSFARLLAQGWPLAAVAVPMLIACTPLVRRRRADRRIDFLLLLLAAGIITGVMQQSGDGVDVNAGMDAVIALSMAGGLAFAESRYLLQLALLSAPVLALIPITIRAEADEFVGRAEEIANWSIVQARVDHAKGPVACHNPAFCYWAGRDMGIDFFLYGQRMLVRHDATALEQAIAGRRFALIELEADEASTGETPSPINPLLKRGYRVDAVIDEQRRLLVPFADGDAR